MEKLSYRPGDQFIPIPPSEKNLPTVVAEKFFHVSDANHNTLEGLCFDRTGENLYFVDCMEKNAVMRLNVETKKLTEIIRLTGEPQVSAVKIHKDGRIFIACCSHDWIKAGCVIACNPDGSNPVKIIDEDARKGGLKGYVVDDMVFDSKGGFYITDFIGWTTDPTGGVYYVSPDYKTITPVITNMAAPNGVALSPDESILWVTETLTGRVIRIALNPDGITYPAFGTAVVYHTTGWLGPDSIHTDADGNVYAACYGQARVMIFNSSGWPIGQVLLPDREKGLWIHSSHAVVRPGTQDLYICSAGIRNEGTAIFRAGVFAGANMNSYQFL